MSRFGLAGHAAWGWLRSVGPQRRYLGRDLLAGLPGAVGSVPDGMAAAILAGVNPVQGLYASFAGPITGGLTANTRLMVITTTSASALVRGALVVGGGRRGGGCRGRPGAPPDPPALAHPRPGRGPANRARRPGAGARDRGRLAGVADRGSQPRPGEGFGGDGRRGGQLDRPAKRAQDRGLPGEHPGRVSPAPTAGCSLPP
jgi:Sulfate permease family